MITLLLVFLLFAFVILATSVGVIFGRKPITGSCGGIGALLGKSACDLCDVKDRCEKSGREICEEGEEDCTK